ncbi:NigD1/NigD2 family lipoprotein [Bacteroides reticulotermitis]|uniref:NigD-like C-terminal beta sandwich domain-containing protein n=2 Tax=Bacteroides reticulotermitis TaxID=1133319 RepID=W4UU32_9BACE|nr:NigD-like protein [Bacteroides reticulotermitis]MBB4045386.1 hypothetical protein [Bacteroides reticulotermitis]GAE84133.1 hypothetical protein JCM10512_2452 [Bacteroides reticulotermitis JCM 10512]HJD74465.1 NigD-like protein [Bacteroides reticulotermitis]
MKSSSFFYKTLITATAIISSIGLQSCLDDDDNNNYYYNRYPKALVTVKSSIDETFFLQLDDSTTLLPVNLSASPYGDKEVRALVNYEEVDKPSGIYNKAIQINWIDSILTKSIAPDLGDDNDKVYGTDPVEIVKDWVTIAEDGYLTLRFRTLWGGNRKPHFVNLLLGQDPENPYEVEFRHHAYGDIYGEKADALVAFKLDGLPDTKGKTVKLKLKWQSFNGEKSVEFDYCTRRSVNPQSSAITTVRSNFKMK